MTAVRTMLCFSSYFKGNRFFHGARQAGCQVFLLTVEKLLNAEWAREHIQEVFAMPSMEEPRQVINVVAYLMRSRLIDGIVALDDFDVELVTHIREHFCLPGLGDSAARLFRDKIAMRFQARAGGICVPPFVPLVNQGAVGDFLATVPPPWLMKPRSLASSIGITRLTHPDQVWQRFEQLGDERSFYLLEKMLAGELYHVDSLVCGGRVVFAEVNKYQRPLLEVYQQGGIYATRTLPRHLPEVAALRQRNEQVLMLFGLQNGASHTEFLLDRDGKFYFIETSARVGGANIAEMVEAATGVNLWEEWAKIEVDSTNYRLPTPREEFGGVTISLARQDWPDSSSFTDPEIVFRLKQENHIGLVVRSPSPERVESLLISYTERIARDFHATLPPAEKATN